ncbi:hypothetical protein [Deinococcus aerophilus]|uniref:Uncharacterized protein n=1 Tax=Deinococcus aerophilus TaxID=522488 RepID=A0ABQ2GSH8_9DEIO|nr:hypothetical protein [Deinococcus aerophilus]GGM09298.1 hypothetical protein GCM10010841_17100 [Deinococcus aerophilus]
MARDPLDRAQRRAERRARRAGDPLSAFGGLLIALFVTGLIFGNALVGVTLLVLVALFAAAYFVSAQVRGGLSAVVTAPEFRRSSGLVIPVFVLAGIFGNALLMVLVLLIAALALAAAALTVRAGPAIPQAAPEVPDSAAVPALPAHSSGETISEIDIRALCRGLPPAVAGQVFATVEHLETVAAEAKKSGDTRRSYDARQGLTDYLPNTVHAWKAQAEDQRDLGELTRALEQVREIAGVDDAGGEAGRRAWETQQRFLASRKGEKS